MGLVKWLVSSAVGLVLTLGWWELRDRIRGAAQAEAAVLPSQVWEGGHTIALEVSSDRPAWLHAAFERADRDDGLLEFGQQLSAGDHRFVISVPPHTSGSVSVSPQEASQGARAKIALVVDGEVRSVDQQTLDEPLKPGYGFGAMLEIDDFASGASSD